MKRIEFWIGLSLAAIGVMLPNTSLYTAQPWELVLASGVVILFISLVRDLILVARGANRGAAAACGV